MLNHVDLMGRLVYTPELRRTESGKAVTTIRLACDRTYGDGGTDFPDVTIWNKDAENVCKYLVKGSLVAVEGRLQTRGWEDETGTRHHVVEVVAQTVHFVSSPRKEKATADEPSLPDDGDLPQ